MRRWPKPQTPVDKLEQLTAAQQKRDRKNAKRVMIAARMPEPQSLCPHGKPYGECNACDIAADFAFDAAREERIFGR